MKHWIEEKGECSYCGGNAHCYSCDGRGGSEEDGECSECGGRGVCMECVGGKEQWLFSTAGTGKRGSMVRHDEAQAFTHDGTLPEWWLTYHGIAV